MKPATIDKSTSRIVRNEILSRIMEQGNFTVPDIVDRTGISPTTVAKYVFDMQMSGLLDVIDKVKSEHRGRRPILYGLKSRSLYFIGVDIKYFSLDIGMMDLSGKMLKSKHMGGFRFEDSFSKLEEIVVAVDEFIKELEDVEPDQIQCICFAVGGRVNSALGTSASLFNFEEFRDTSLAEFLKDRLGHQVIVENDTKVMAYGEYMSLGDGSVKDMLYINIGWGLGLGIIVDGKLLVGHKGYAGELGHVPFYDNNVLCHCGKKGCIETEVSGNAVYRKLIQRVKGGEQSFLSKKILSGEGITLKDIIFAAEKEDPLCVDLISQMGSQLGRHVAGIINIFNPECIIVGGTFAEAATYYFLHPMNDSIRKYSLRLMSNDIQVKTSILGERSGVIGACILARNRSFLEQYC